MKPKRALPGLELPIETDVGTFLARYSEAGLASLNFPDQAQTYPGKRSPISNQVEHWHLETTTALKAILSGVEPQRFPPFDVSSGTEFQQRVWQALRQIPFGQTRTYAAIAAAVGSPDAVRAVGGACGANPIPVLIPCHRVLAAGNRIGGFSGGLDWKRLLLERERVLLPVSD